MRPMLATPTSTPGIPPAGEGWVHEIKWDGVRALAETRGGSVRLFNRTEGEISVAYPEVVAAGAGLPDGLLLDGELIALNADGVPSFHSITPRMHVRSAERAARWAAERPVSYVVFDILQAAGKDLTGLPLVERRAHLAELTMSLGWQISDLHTNGEALAHATRAAGLEGVVSKQKMSRYVPGARSTDWVKTPHRTELVGVIGGWIPEGGDGKRLGAVWLGHPADESTFMQQPVLYSLGRAGSGLSHAEKDTLLEVLRTIERPSAPFDPAPKDAVSRRARWVEPVLCVQVRYLNVTPDGVLRQPVLVRLRPDVSPLEAPTVDLNPTVA